MLSLPCHSCVLSVLILFNFSDLGLSSRVRSWKDAAPPPSKRPPPAQVAMEKDFDRLQHVHAETSEVVETTWVTAAGEGPNAQTYVVHDLTLGSKHCPPSDELSDFLKQSRLLSGGRSGSIVVMAGADKLVFKNVASVEFDMLVPLILKREVLGRPPNASALYHQSLISPLCWGLSPVRTPGMVWIVMPNIVVPPSAALDPICAERGAPSSRVKIFDIKGKRNNGPVRSGVVQSLFGQREDWEYGLEQQFPGGFTFESAADRRYFMSSLNLDLEALSSQGLCDYSLMLAVYGCDGDAPDTAISKATSNAYDFPVRTIDGKRWRVSMALIDFGMKYADIAWIEKRVGAKGWSAKDYGNKLKGYIVKSLFKRF